MPYFLGGILYICSYNYEGVDIVKKRVNMSIDKEIINKTKELVPNVSKFVEEFLKDFNRLSSNNEEYNKLIKQSEQIIATENQKIATIHTLMDYQHENSNAEKLKIQKTWYEFIDHPSDENIETYCKVLGFSKNQLIIIQAKYFKYQSEFPKMHTYDSNMEEFLEFLKQKNEEIPKEV